ncbi:MAG: hypothetical protein GX591_17900 [Planctomycetes bacterium]|nr:hypothetical protein [Planctomycetota bacterium]
MKAFDEQEWLAYRRKMIAETERFIEWGLKHPDLVTWIPSKPVNQGGYPRRVATWFYSVVFPRR